MINTIDKTVKSAGLNRPVSYRFGDRTSKITIHPSLFDALSRKYGGEKETRKWIIEKSCEACRLNLRPTPYVREKALLVVLPDAVTKGYTLNLEMESLTYDTCTGVRGLTKCEFGKPMYTSVLSLSAMMSRLVKHIDEYAGKAVRTERMNNLKYSSIAEMANAHWMEHNGKDVSFFVKKELIETFAVK